MSILYIIATPIGNLEDITLRALRVLREVAYVLCEDTRVTKKLLAHYNINTHAISCGARSSRRQIERILELLRAGKNLALVADSGTPTISDPGVYIVSEVMRELGDSVNVVPVPGPNAAVAALSAAGLPASEFLFLGFLPHKKGRTKLLGEIVASERTVVFYESPHRILKLLRELEQIFGAHRVLSEGKQIILAREITKVYEEFLRGTPTELLDFFEKHAEKVRGEFVVIVA